MRCLGSSAVRAFASAAPIDPPAPVSRTTLLRTKCITAVRFKSISKPILSFRPAIFQPEATHRNLHLRISSSRGLLSSYGVICPLFPKQESELHWVLDSKREAGMHSHVRFNRGLGRQYHKWMKAMHYAGTTQTTYLKALHQYVGFMGQRSLARAKHTDIRLFIAHASENGATLGSVYRHLGILRQFYDFLNLGGVVDYVAPRFVRLRLPWHQRPRVLSEAQVRQLILATRTPRERALIEFFYSTGCRLNEARHIKIENIDFVASQA